MSLTAQRLNQQLALGITAAIAWVHGYLAVGCTLHNIAQSRGPVGRCCAMCTQHSCGHHDLSTTELHA